MTKQRQLIWNIIQQSCEHMTADEIYQLAKRQIPSIAIGTVYRNLKLMAQAGEILRLNMQDSPDRYDKTRICHEHLTCKYCGKLKDVQVHNLKEILEQQIVETLDSYHLNMYYVCPECYNEEEKNDE